MKVHISFTVDVDPEAWAAEYGIALSEVREDVRSYITGGVSYELRQLGHEGLVARQGEVGK